MNKRDIYRSIIVSNSSKPSMMDKPHDSTYLKISSSVDSCTDKFDIFLKIENKIIQDATFKGEGRATTTASINLLLQYIEHNSLVDANAIVTNFLNMIHKREFDSSKVKDLIAFEDVSYQAQALKSILAAPQELKRRLDELQI